jgi:low affinity Fe/Cu permease
MVFLIQNTQNRDSAAIPAKLDELYVSQQQTLAQKLEAQSLPKSRRELSMRAELTILPEDRR